MENKQYPPRWEVDFSNPNTNNITTGTTTGKPMENNKQTAVEWLINQLEEQIRKSAHNELGTTRTGEYRIGLRKAIDFCEQAKQIEKEQIEQSFVACWKANVPDGIECKLSANEYYNKNYEQ